ncbi:MAG: glycosyltransferase family 2 protein [Candidatus Paceibacterota bacterium]|jgi:cellulose synthase/poly-beta-1,6-N-acetylglucosamine synthase-like glycosyltransferase
MKNNKKQNSLPLVSVIMPIRNEEKYIKECLEQIICQKYPKNKMEILVIDGMSEDKTREIVNRESTIANRKFNIHIRLIDNPKKNRFPALNIGVKNAKGDFIFRVDARTIIPKDYILKCVTTLLETGADNVGGIQKPLAVKGTQQAIGLAMSHPFGVGNAQFRIGKKSGFVDSVYLGCFRKSIFKKIGLFDEKSGIISEDSDINHRIRVAGGRVYLNKDIIAYYYPRDNFKDLWKLYFRYGGSRAGNFYKHGTLRLRQLVPPGFLATIVLLMFLSLITLLFLKILCTILVGYALIDIVFSFWLAIKNNRAPLFLKLLIIFPCMHFAWALGFFKRLFQGRNYKKDWQY